MGTIGLSFGSPTSGTGFDVSATVASIVSNLEKVESPWKAQLSSLESQDAAISNLGSLFSNVSNDLSQLTDFEGIMAQKTGSSSDDNVLEVTGASSSAVAGTHTIVVNSLATTSSGYLTPISDATDTLSGSITLKVGSGNDTTIDVDKLSDQTLNGLAAAINSSGAGVTASVLTDSSGSRLNLVSGTSGAGGTITVTANSIADTSNSNTSLSYTASSVVPADAQLTVDGVTGLTSSSNTVTNLIKGITFQLLAPSPTQSGSSSQEVIQMVIGNYNSGVESAVNSLVSDYNTLISAVNTQEGLDASGNSEPLFGSPTLSLLQQQLLSGLNMQNPNGYLDAVASNENATLAGSITFTTASGLKENVVIGPAPNTLVANTIYTGSGSDANTLQGLSDAINSVSGYTALSYTGTAGSDTTYATGTLTPVFNTGAALSGEFKIQVGSGTVETVVIGAEPSSPTANTIYTGSGTTTLASVAQAINNANIGVGASVATTSSGVVLTLTSGTLGAAGNLTVTTSSPPNAPADQIFSLEAAGLGITAGVRTSNNQSNLTLASQTAGSSGALTVDSSIAATTDTLLSYSGEAGTSTENSYGSLYGIADDSDALTGSIVIQVGSGVAQTVTLDSTQNSLSALATAITDADIGVTATVVANSNGSGPSTLLLTSNTAGSAGTLTVTSNILDTTETKTASVNYNNSSDISTLANLGITISQKDDGSLEFDANVLDSVLNSDYNSVLGFFQNIDSWGQTFASMLTNSGSSSSTGTLKLALTSDSNIESTLNTNISNEESLISAEQKSLTAELNSANEILQALPSQLNGVDELYSAITGYNKNSSS